MGSLLAAAVSVFTSPQIAYSILRRRASNRSIVSTAVLSNEFSMVVVVEALSVVVFGDQWIEVRQPLAVHTTRGRGRNLVGELTKSVEMEIKNTSKCQGRKYLGWTGCVFG